jgi:uncharacterized protein YdaT
MFEEELETLEAIFMEDLTVSEDRKKISLRMLPFADTDDDTLNKVGIKLELEIPSDYPCSAPNIVLQSIRGVPKRALDDLEKLLKQEAQSHIGEQMIFVFTEVVKDWLGENNKDEEEILKSAREAALKSSKAIIKDNYHEGTPVTVETYNDWWNSFKEEKIKEVVNSTMATGRMFFAKLGDGATGDEGISEEDSGEIIDEKEPAQTEINWEVFVASELTEFDELSADDFEESAEEKEANEKK